MLGLDDRDRDEEGNVNLFGRNMGFRWLSTFLAPADESARTPE